MTHSLSLSARLRALEEQTLPLADLRERREAAAAVLAQLDQSIQEGETAEAILASAEFILLPLLNGEVSKKPVLDAPAEMQFEGPQILAEPEAEQAQGVDVQEPEGEEDQVQEVDVQEPAPADAADDQEKEAEKAPETAPYRLSAPAQVLEWFSGVAIGWEFTAQDCADATGLAVSTVKGHLINQKEKGRIEVLAGTGFPGNPSRYFRPAPGQAAALAEDSSALLPIPPKLSTDECSLFDALRRVPMGMGARLLCSRLNWNSGRVASAAKRLTELGYVGQDGDLLHVIPVELRERAAD